MAQIGACWAPTSWKVPAWEVNTWEGGTPVEPVDAPPSPHSLVFLTGNTDRIFLSDTGVEMPSPVQFTVGSTGPFDMALVGADGGRENLAGASVTLVVQSVNGGTPIVNGVVLTVLSEALGTVRWSRTAPQTATSGDYVSQVRVVRSDGSVGLYPDSPSSASASITMLAAIGS